MLTVSCLRMSNRCFLKNTDNCPVLNPYNTHSRSTSLFRRRLLFAAGLLFLWPLLRFIGFKVPKKPRIVEVAGKFRNAQFISKDEFIVFTDATDIWAVSRSCTHLGCRLNFKEKAGYLECPCHQSRFTMYGEVLHGPAQKPLTRYPVETTEGSDTYLITIT